MIAICSAIFETVFLSYGPLLIGHQEWSVTVCPLKSALQSL